MRFADTVELALKPSLGLLRWVMLLHVVPLVLLPLAVPPGLPMLLLAAGFGLSWWWLRRHPALGFGPRAIGRITWHAEGGFTLHTAGGERIEATLRPDSSRWPGLLVLRFDLLQEGRPPRPSGPRTLTRLIANADAEAAPLWHLRARLAATGTRG